ncbi:MAG: hypothetical protein QOJ91_1402 [Sphingomonadales bacterium]|jgi:hypothetical protein|nr:hypothetical protein [Sphingomonadales bacterium]
MRELNLEEFRGREGQAFDLLNGEERLPFTLTRVQELRPSGRAAGAFTLDWQGPAEPVLPQAIYTLRQGEEDFEMFIVPLKQERDCVRYEAVFN